MSIHWNVKEHLKDLYTIEKTHSFAVVYNYVCDIERYFELQEMWNLDALYSDKWTKELDKEYSELRDKLTKGMK